MHFLLREWGGGGECGLTWRVMSCIVVTRTDVGLLLYNQINQFLRAHVCVLGWLGATYFSSTLSPSLARTRAQAKFHDKRFPKDFQIFITLIFYGSCRIRSVEIASCDVGRQFEWVVNLVSIAAAASRGEKKKRDKDGATRSKAERSEHHGTKG